MRHVQAWRKYSEFGIDGAQSPWSGVSGSPARRAGFSSPGSPSPYPAEVGFGCARVSEIFAQEGRLDFAIKIEDGFQDYGPGCVPAMSSTASTDVGSETLIVDRQDDNFLAEFLDKLSKKILRANDVVTRIMVAALLTSESLGRSGHHAANTSVRFGRLLLERADPTSGAIKLGDLMHDLAAPGGNKGKQPGAGFARHRAILFKVVADTLNIAPCSLNRDEDGVYYNVVLADGEPRVLDVMFDPGALYSEGSGKASEYLKRLRQDGDQTQEAEAATSPSPGVRRKGTAVPPAPSMQPNLGGRMLRPSWHVEPWEIEFDRRDRAGRGGFGEVFQGTWAGQPTAVKEVRDANPTDSDVSDFTLEISLLSRLSHPNVIRFWRGCVDLRGGQRTLLLVTEWMDRGVLSAFLHESDEPNLTVGQMQVLAVGIGRGVAYLHDVKILHLDLKSPNVLLNSSWHCKLCDFGLAKLREQTALHTTLRGVSPIWAPPEMFEDKAGGLTEKADVYSFGIIVFELAARKLPFAGVSQMQLPRVKAKGHLPAFPEDIDVDMASLSKECLARKPKQRPTMQALITKVHQMGQSRGLDLQDEQTKMEKRGFHFGGPSGSTPNVEQLRRAEAGKRRAESEVARVRKLLLEEEKRVAALEVEVARKIGVSDGDNEDSRQKRIEEFCTGQTQAVGEGRFRCAICRKLFRGPEFVHKHVRERHLDDVLVESALSVDNSAEKPQASKGNGADHFFDADVAEESNVRAYTNTISRVNQNGGKDRFCQALQDAAETGDLSRIQQCLLQGGPQLPQTDIDGLTPLHLSARQGHADCVQYMLSNGADVECTDEGGLTPLHLAAQEGRVSTTQLLLQAGATASVGTSAKNRAALHFAAANGHREACSLLLMHKASANVQDVDGESPLHNAARFGGRELCEVILSFGAAVNIADKDGWSPLHEAARWGDGELIECLLQRGADVGTKSNDGESALHVVPGGYAEHEVVEALLKWRCDVNCRDYDGESPLHVAVKLGDPDIAGVLLNSGADANVSNHAGATPLDFAKKDEIRWLLRSFKARKGTGTGA